MLGPAISAYLVVSVILFVTGAIGVLVRRSPLIVLLALEIMLNAGNLALIAFARQRGDGAGQIFALAVMVVAAAEAVVGLGLIVAMSRAGGRITRRQAGLIASASVGVSFFTSAYALVRLLGEGPEERVHPSTLWTWLSAGDFRVGMEIVVDPLYVFMMLVVSGVGD